MEILCFPMFLCEPYERVIRLVTHRLRTTVLVCGFFHLNICFVLCPFWWPVETPENEGRHFLSSQDPTLHTWLQPYKTLCQLRIAGRKEAIPEGWSSCTSLCILCGSYPACLTFPNPVRWVSMGSSAIELGPRGPSWPLGPLVPVWPLLK